MEGIQINHAQDDIGKTGVTVCYFPKGAIMGSCISGGGPASREIPLTSPLTADNTIDALVLSGGSAFGLGCTQGVVECLEANGIGYDTGYAKIPLVVGSCIYDLGYGSASIRPDYQMGYEACRKALKESSSLMGNIGAGMGATVGKLCGMKQASKAGLGIASKTIGSLEIMAVVVVNAAGDVFDARKNKIAGLMNQDRTSYLSSLDVMETMLQPHDIFTGNTTIGVVVTNAKFSKADMSKIARMANCAYARSICPVGTMADGDTIYAASVGNEIVDINAVGTFAAETMQQAIENAITSSKIEEEEFLANVK